MGDQSSQMPRRRWYLKPGGIPVPETDRKAVEGARYTCLEGDECWTEIPTWRPPEEIETSRSSRGRRGSLPEDRASFFEDEKELFRERIE